MGPTENKGQGAREDVEPTEVQYGLIRVTPEITFGLLNATSLPLTLPDPTSSTRSRRVATSHSLLVPSRHLLVKDSQCFVRTTKTSVTWSKNVLTKERHRKSHPKRPH